MLRTILLIGLMLLAGPAKSQSLAFSSYYGGNGQDYAQDAAMQGSDLLVVGYTDSTDLPTPDGQQKTKAFGTDAFLLRVGADNSLAYARYINGAGDEYPLSITVADNGKIHITGVQYRDGDANCFVMRFSAVGLLEFSHIFGGSGYDECRGIVVDVFDRIYVTGRTSSTNLPVTANALQSNKGAGSDALFAVFEPDGTRSYTSYIGGDGDQIGNGISFRLSHAFITGTTNASGNQQAFVMKVDPDATFPEASEWVRTIGGSGSDRGQSIAVDSSGSSYIVGYTNSADLPVTGPVFGPTLQGSYSCLFASLDVDGNILRTGYGEADTDCRSVKFIVNEFYVAGHRGSRRPYAMTFFSDMRLLPFSATMEVEDGGMNGFGVALLPHGDGYRMAGYTAWSNLPLLTEFQADQPGTDAFVAQIMRYRPRLRANDCSTNEGAQGQQNGCPIRITLDAAAIAPISFHAATGGGNAAPFADYTPLDSTHVIQPPGTSLEIPVSVLGDNIDEDNEYGLVRISNVQGPVALSDAEARFNIQDDDTPPVLSVDNGGCSASESAGHCTFVVRLSAASGLNVTFTSATANGTATDGSDFSGHGATARTIPAGQTALSINVPITNDAFDEAGESFTLHLGSVVNATPGSLTATGTIHDDDPVPALSVDGGGCSVSESAGHCTFVVRLSAASGLNVTFTSATANGTATDGSDFSGHGTTARAIPAGQTALSIVVPVTNDAFDEANETFTLNLASIVSATPGSLTATGTIQDDDPLPALSVDNGGCSVSESAGHCAFVVRLSAVSGLNVTFTTATANGSATGGSDYTGHGATARSIPAGQTALSILVPILNDALVEPDEVFSLNLGSVTHATPGSLTATGTIRSDDTGPTITVNAISLAENAGSASLNVVLSASSSVEVRVDHVTEAETATSGVDFAPASGTLVFAPGQTSRSIVVALNNDSLDEVDETLGIVLSNPVNATPAPGARGRITIQDEDPSPYVIIEDCDAVEGHSGERPCTFVIRLSAPSGRQVSVGYGPDWFKDAFLLTDFESPELGSGFATIRAGQTIEDWIVDSGAVDVVHESFWQAGSGDQSLDLNGEQPGLLHTSFEIEPGINYRLHWMMTGSPGCGGGLRRMAWLWNGTSLGEWTVSSAGATASDMRWRHYEQGGLEPASEMGMLSAASLTEGACGPVLDSVLVMREGSAAPVFDFASAFASVTFQPGQTQSSPQSVMVRGDTVDESDETVPIRVFSGTGIDFTGTVAGTLTILDDDLPGGRLFQHGFE